MAPTGYREVASASRLSQMEEEQVVARAKGGCPRSTEYLLRKYRGFVEGKARRYFLPGAEAEDVVQEGMIGLYKAIRDFRDDKPAAFRSFVELCVTRQIITAVKAAGRNKNAVLSDCISLNSALGHEDEDGCLMDVLADGRGADPERILQQRLTMECLGDRAATGLSELERVVLSGYLQGKTYSEMSGELDRPAKTIDNALQRAKRKVGRALCPLN